MSFFHVSQRWWPFTGVWIDHDIFLDEFSVCVFLVCLLRRYINFSIWPNPLVRLLAIINMGLILRPVLGKPLWVKKYLIHWQPCQSMFLALPSTSVKCCSGICQTRFNKKVRAAHISDDTICDHLKKFKEYIIGIKNQLLLISMIKQIVILKLLTQNLSKYEEFVFVVLSKNSSI